VLREYPLLKLEAARLEGEREHIAGAIPCGIVQLPPGGRTGRKTDRTAGQAFKLLELDGGHGGARRYVRAVDDMLRLLDSETRRMVRLRYFKRWTAARGGAETVLERENRPPAAGGGARVAGAAAGAVRATRGFPGR
jgi:hypothetical protein